MLWNPTAASSEARSTSSGTHTPPNRTRITIVVALGCSASWSCFPQPVELHGLPSCVVCGYDVGSCVGLPCVHDIWVLARDLAKRSIVGEFVGASHERCCLEPERRSSLQHDLTLSFDVQKEFELQCFVGSRVGVESPAVLDAAGKIVMVEPNVAILGAMFCSLKVDVSVSV